MALAANTAREQAVYSVLLYPCARTNYEYWTRVGGAVLVRSWPPLTLSGKLSCTGGTQNRKSAERCSLLAIFRVFSHILAVFSRK